LTITLTYQAMLMIPTSSLKIYTAASAYMIDTAGLLVGRKLGGRFVDRGDWLRGVSPNKSWEGYAAGLVVSCLMASFFVPGVEVDRPGPEGESVVGCFSKLSPSLLYPLTPTHKLRPPQSTSLSHCSPFSHPLSVTCTIASASVLPTSRTQGRPWGLLGEFGIEWIRSWATLWLLLLT
jgi:CDP-diglyceride synthetase